jgi:hypothetical protein
MLFEKKNDKRFEILKVVSIYDCFFLGVTSYGTVLD